MTLKCRVVSAVLEHLVKVVIVVYDLIVYHLAHLLHRNDLRVDETAVWLETECGVTLENLCMKLRIDIDCIFLDKRYVPGLPLLHLPVSG